MKMSNYSIKIIYQIKYITRMRNYFPCIVFRSSSSSVKLSYTSYKYPEESLDPPVFIFHGIVGNKMQWADVGKKILSLTKRNVVAVDLRNHGDSPHVNSHKYTDLAKDVLLLLEMLGVKQASLIGHSMGGRTAMCVALMAPHKVSGLQVVDVSPKSTPQDFKEYIPKLLNAMKAINFNNTNNVEVAQKIAAKQLKHMVTDDLILADLLTNVREKKDGTIGWVCNIDVLLKDYEYLVSFPKVRKGMTYDGPTLFVGGQLSEFIPFPKDVSEDVRKKVGEIFVIKNETGYQHEAVQFIRIILKPQIFKRKPTIGATLGAIPSLLPRCLCSVK